MNTAELTKNKCHINLICIKLNQSVLDKDKSNINILYKKPFQRRNLKLNKRPAIITIYFLSFPYSTKNILGNFTSQTLYEILKTL